jgi:hypothetical protein
MINMIGFLALSLKKMKWNSVSDTLVLSEDTHVEIFPHKIEKIVYS